MLIKGEKCMKERILKEFEAINSQIKGFDSKIDAKLKAQKEEICSEVRQELKEDLNTISQEFEDKLDINLEKFKNYIISEVSKAIKEKSCLFGSISPLVSVGISSISDKRSPLARRA